ncbi:MAG: DUF1697 domain-containing protein [Prolixibacteraceae bacterium]
MDTFVVFLKGVNIGGHNRVKMDVLKKALTELRFERVKTYINSGNLILQSKQGKEKIVDQVAQVIRTNFGINVNMIIKTANELTDIAEKSPFSAETECDYDKRAVVMLSERVDPVQLQVFKDEGKVSENYYLTDDLLFVYYHNGFAKTKLTSDYIERKLRVITTARNWNTILKLRDMIRNE